MRLYVYVFVFSLIKMKWALHFRSMICPLIHSTIPKAYTPLCGSLKMIGLIRMLVMRYAITHKCECLPHKDGNYRNELMLSNWISSFIGIASGIIWTFCFDLGNWDEGKINFSQRMSKLVSFSENANFRHVPQITFAFW